MQTIASVRITIEDENDNIPLFGSTLYTASFPEDISNGVEVIVVGYTYKACPFVVW